MRTEGSSGHIPTAPGPRHEATQGRRGVQVVATVDVQSLDNGAGVWNSGMEATMAVEGFGAGVGLTWWLALALSAVVGWVASLLRTGRGRLSSRELWRRQV